MVYLLRGLSVVCIILAATARQIIRRDENVETTLFGSPRFQISDENGRTFVFSESYPCADKKVVGISIVAFEGNSTKSGAFTWKTEYCVSADNIELLSVILSPWTKMIYFTYQIADRKIIRVEGLSTDGKPAQIPILTTAAGSVKPSILGTGFAELVWILTPKAISEIENGHLETATSVMTFEADETPQYTINSNKDIVVLGQYGADKGYFLRKSPASSPSQKKQFRIAKEGLDVFSPTDVSKTYSGGVSGVLSTLQPPLISCGSTIYFLFTDDSTKKGLTVATYSAVDFSAIAFKKFVLPTTEYVTSVTCWVEKNNTFLLAMGKGGSAGAEQTFSSRLTFLVGVFPDLNITSRFFLNATSKAIGGSGAAGVMYEPILLDYTASRDSLSLTMFGEASNSSSPIVTNRKRLVGSYGVMDMSSEAVLVGLKLKGDLGQCSTGLYLSSKDGVCLACPKEFAGIVGCAGGVETSGISQGWKIAVGVVGGTVGIVIVVCLIGYMRQRKKRMDKLHQHRSLSSLNGEERGSTWSQDRGNEFWKLGSIAAVSNGITQRFSQTSLSHKIPVGDGEYTKIQADRNDTKAGPRIVSLLANGAAAPDMEISRTQYSIPDDVYEIPMSIVNTDTLARSAGPEMSFSPKSQHGRLSGDMAAAGIGAASAFGKESDIKKETSLNHWYGSMPPGHNAPKIATHSTLNLAPLQQKCALGLERSAMMVSPIGELSQNDHRMSIIQAVLDEEAAMDTSSLSQDHLIGSPAPMGLAENVYGDHLDDKENDLPKSNVTEDFVMDIEDTFTPYANAHEETSVGVESEGIPPAAEIIGQDEADLGFTDLVFPTFTGPGEIPILKGDKLLVTQEWGPAQEPQELMSCYTVPLPLPYKPNGGQIDSHSQLLLYPSFTPNPAPQLQRTMSGHITDDSATEKVKATPALPIPLLKKGKISKKALSKHRKSRPNRVQQQQKQLDDLELDVMMTCGDGTLDRKIERDDGPVPSLVIGKLA